MINPFYRLAPYIQEYIYRAGWGELRGVQVKAIDAVLDTNDHILITSGTASGKTEAAFLPILTQLHEQPSSSIGVLYVGPLKALINDQFYRLDGLLNDIDMPVQAWHGDVAQNKKTKFLREGRGVLQITPESLEAMLMRRPPGDLARLFGDLRFVVIDELHAFINSDRGRQVLCQLQRLARYQKTPARRIGLSATLGEPELAMGWLRGGTELGVVHVDDQGGKRVISIGMEHFWQAKDEPEMDIIPEDEADVEHSEYDDDEQDNEPDEYEDADELDDESADEYDGELDNERDHEYNDEIHQPPIDPDRLYRHMLDMVEGATKTLIFANSRHETETIIHSLRSLSGVEDSEETDGGGSFYVHHGAVSAALREQAEEVMRDPNKRACVAATVTLELGIDLGSLDQVLQQNATTTVSSFVQRLGRSGRRGTPPKMFFYCVEEMYADAASLGDRIPWNLIQLIAIIQLYLEEKWIEPPQIPHLPMSLLYHQTMSILASEPGLRPPELAERVLSLSPFHEIGFDRFRDLLRHLQGKQHIQIEPDTREILIGAVGERIVNDYHFYATFETATEYLVRHGTEEIGTIQFMPPNDERFALAGRSWRVIESDPEKKIVQVERIKGKAKAKWMGGDREIHTRIVQRMRRVLDEDDDYGYLQVGAVERLKQARWLAKTSELATKPILHMGGTSWMLMPWSGTRALKTMALLLQHQKILVLPPEDFYLDVKSEDEKALRASLSALVDNPPTVDELAASLSEMVLQRNKYDHFVPEELLRAAFALDALVLDEALDCLSLITR